MVDDVCTRVFREVLVNSCIPRSACILPVKIAVWPDFISMFSLLQREYFVLLPLKIKMATRLSRIIILFIPVLTLNIYMHAYTEQEAKQVLENTLAQFTHKGGAKIGYRFKISRLFDRSGTFMFKDDKSLAFGKKDIVWNNGKTVWILDKKARSVKIMNPKESREGHKSLDEELELVKNSYKLSMTDDGDNYCIHMKAIKRKADIKQGYLYVNKKTYVPVHVRMKVAFIWATIDIWDFEKADYKDEMFTFPSHKYPNVTVIDKR